MLTITKLEHQIKNPGRVNIYLNGEFAFGISLAIAPWLEEGAELSPQRVKDLQTQDETERAYQRAINYLSYRNRSEEEIRKNLRKHQIAEEHIDSVLERLRQASLVDDLVFAREWVENRCKHKPRGKRALATELYQKGIKSQIIDDVLGELDEESLAMQFARQKLPKLTTLDRSAFQKKLSGFLSRRGFPYGISKEIISTLWEEIEKQS
jgi:regulatory protein